MQKHTKPLVVKNVEEQEVEVGEDTKESPNNTPLVVKNVEESEVEGGEVTKESLDTTPVVEENVEEPEVEEGGETKEGLDNTMVEMNAEEPEVEVGEDTKEGPDYTPQVTFGRFMSDEGFAVWFDDEWVDDPAKLSIAQKNRLEKNLAEAQRWLGVEVNRVEEVSVPVGKPFNRAVVPPLVPEKVIEKHKRQMSILEQVDDILQGLLESSPLAETQIRLTEMPNKGVIVWVGKEYFEGIEAVPDEDVKHIIRQAVKKWEEVSGA